MFNMYPQKTCLSYHEVFFKTNRFDLDYILVSPNSILLTVCPLKSRVFLRPPLDKSETCYLVLL